MLCFVILNWFLNYRIHERCVAAVNLPDATLAVPAVPVGSLLSPVSHRPLHSSEYSLRVHDCDAAQGTQYNTIVVQDNIYIPLCHGLGNDVTSSTSTNTTNIYKLKII